ncbi:MAG TPA: hypothetical protein VNQ73_11250 [Ilumatobacter sp.]|nr:hypothetical protein [Ilumatobacter sp.]
MRIAARSSTLIPLALVASLTGCGGGDDQGTGAVERMIERAAGGDADITIDGDSGSFRLDSDEGSVDFSTSGRLPDDWPADVALPDGLAITSSSSIDGGASGHMIAVSGTAALTLDEFDAFYRQALDGWSEALRTTSDLDGSPTLNVVYQQGTRSLAVGGVSHDGGTDVTFSYSYVPDAEGTGSDTTDTDIGDVDTGDGGIRDALGVGDALDLVDVEVVAGALVSALDAERYEMDGETIHVYLGDSYDAMMACIVATAVVADNPVVVHDATGTTSPC